MPRQDSTCTDCITCDYENSITSFPLDLTTLITESNYDEVDEPITMNFQWSTRSIPPEFVITSPGQIDEGGITRGSGITNTTTLNFNNLTYTLYSVQIVSATHNKWVIPATANNLNKEDILITFQNLSSSFATYVLVVLPILRTGSAQPTYLQGLSSNQPSLGTYSLSSCLPTNKNALFAYYVTCLDGYTAHKNPDNAYVFIAVQGVPVAESLMQSMENKIGPTPILPFQSRFADKISGLGRLDFNKYILSTRVLLDYSAARTAHRSIDSREDPTNAYKCIPLDPDKDIVDNKINVDLKSGTLLSSILAERAGLINDTAPTPQTRAQQQKINLMFESVFGAVLAFILVVLVGYSVYTYTNGPVVVDTSLPSSPWLVYIGIAVVCIIVGITIGVMVF